MRTWLYNFCVGWLLASVSICYANEFLDSSQESENFQNFLDTHQYTKKNISRYEKMYGEGYISTGGAETTQEFLKMLNLKSDQQVLDVGCGVGGGDFYMAETYGVKVKAVDLSKNMISIARSRKPKGCTTVNFEILDINKAEFPPESFDSIFSKDTIIHIAQKRELFQKFFIWLKPNGVLIISDYCCGKEDFSEGFKEYIKEFDYHFIDIDHYRTLLNGVGFRDVRAEDRTWQFVASMTRELKNIENSKEKFLKSFKLEDYYHLVYGWHNKLNRCSAGEQKWGLFIARK